MQSENQLAGLGDLSLQGQDGALVSNYHDLSLAQTSVSVTPATLAVSLQDFVTKVYDGKANISNVLLNSTGLLSDDQVTVVGKGAFDGIDAGDAVAFTLNGFELSGSGSENYQVDQTLTGIGSITPKYLTIQNTIVADKVFDGNRNALVIAGTLNGLVGDEKLGVSATGLFDDPAVGQAKRVAVNYGLSDGEHRGLAKNYVLLSEYLSASITASKKPDPDRRPFVNPVTPDPVKPIIKPTPSKVSSSTTADIVDVKLSLTDLHTEQCAASGAEKCDCQTTLFEEVLLCQVAAEGSGHAAHASQKAKAKAHATMTDFN